MIAVGMVEVAIDEIIDMIAVGNGLVPAIGTVDMAIVVGSLVVMIPATSRVGVCHRYDMLFDFTVAFLMMEVPIMKVIDMVAMPNSGVPAVSSVLVIMIGVGFARSIAHVRSNISGPRNVKMKWRTASRILSTPCFLRFIAEESK